MSIVEYCGGMAARAVAMVVGTVVSAVGGMVMVALMEPI
jgi:hypothetical protein